MGACSVFMTVKSTDRKEVEQAFNDKVEDCLYEYGHDRYNGTFSTMSGIEISSKKFSDRNSASDYILEHTNKWEDALAVIVEEDGKEPYTLIGGWAAE